MSCLCGGGSGKKKPAQQTETQKPEENKEEKKEPAAPKPPVPCKALPLSIICAKGLRDADWMPGSNVSDPLVICEIPGKPLLGCQTGQITDCLDPQFDFSCELVGLEEGDSLMFKVVDRDWLKPDDLLGKVELSCDQLAKSFAGELDLLESRNKTAKLTIKVGKLEPLGKK